MIKTKPLVSFIIRTKNEQRFIGQVLDAVFKQSYKNIEVLIIDSGSTDRTLQIVKNFPVKIFKIKSQDFSYSYALNYGINKSSGKYICIISGHSLPVSDYFLDDGIKVLKEKNVAGISGSSPDFAIGYFNRFIGRFALFLNKKRIDYTPWLTNTNSLIKKSFWEKYHFDEELASCEDYDWAKEMLSRGYNIVKIRSFAVFHSHWLLGRRGYLLSLPAWKKQIIEIDKKIRD